MASISMNVVPTQSEKSTSITGGEKFVVLDSTGKFTTVGVNQILDKVDDGIVDRIDDQVLEKVENQIDTIIDERLENIDHDCNIKWNEVYD